MSGAICRFDPVADFERVDEPDVQISGQDRVVEERLAAKHRVLVVTEPWQSVFDEVIQCLKRVGAGNSVAERSKGSDVRRKSCLNQLQHFARDRVRFEFREGRHEQISLRRLPVFGIEIPLAALRSFAIHQQAGFAAHLAIEVFHAQLFAAFRPGRKTARRADETCVGKDVYR